VARHINRALAAKDGPIVPFIAETGGVNALIVDATALPEQVADDVVTSAFRSAGQRCSALRLLLVQEDIADRMIDMIVGSTRELKIGDPREVSTHCGPVIDAEAKEKLEAHIARMKREAVRTHYAGEVQAAFIAEHDADGGAHLPNISAYNPFSPGSRGLGEEATRASMPNPGASDFLSSQHTRTEHAVGYYVAPHVFELDRPEALAEEVFGPVLHVARYPAGDLERVLDAVEASGYGLTLGVHSRIDATIERVTERLAVGNVYVNRNMIGAVVGVQPFGGHGLSGTGPKAGGPHYLLRFATEQTLTVNTAAAGGNAGLLAMEE
jgi:RHH-type proline utilization regulon transcriptional repressor/proline dehydrogenase/delta 1-pyrroline-5-carboxylate dehydrogenase